MSWWLPGGRGWRKKYDIKEMSKNSLVALQASAFQVTTDHSIMAVDRLVLEAAVTAGPPCSVHLGRREAPAVDTTHTPLYLEWGGRGSCMFVGVSHTNGALAAVWFSLGSGRMLEGSRLKSLLLFWLWSWLLQGSLMLSCCSRTYPLRICFSDSAAVTLYRNA